MFLSTTCAVLAAVLFAATTNLQRVAAGAVPGVHGPLALIARLVRDVRWLLAAVVGVAALGLHALALAWGSVTVVQAVMALGLVFTLALEAARERRALRRHELTGAVLVVAGVALVVAAGRPALHGHPSVAPVLLVAVLVVVASVLLLVASRSGVGGRHGARLLAGLAGVCFAVDAVFMQRLAAVLAQGRVEEALRAAGALHVAADLAGFLATAAVGTVCVHRAYQVAPLREAQPAVASAEPVTAFVLGVGLLGEGVRWGTTGYAVVAAGLAALTVGIVVGARDTSGGRDLDAPARTRVPAVTSLPVPPVTPAPPLGAAAPALPEVDHVLPTPVVGTALVS